MELLVIFVLVNMEFMLSPGPAKRAVGNVRNTDGNNMSKFEDINVGDRFEVKGDNYHITKSYKKTDYDTAMQLGGSITNGRELVYKKFSPDDEIYVPRIYTSGHWKRWKT